MDLTGETHQGILDLSFFKLVPNLKVFAPKNFKELEEMLEFAIKSDGPIVIRYPRGGESNIKLDNSKNTSKNDEKSESIENAEILQEGKDVTIIAIGKMVARSMEVAEKLKLENIDAEIINVRCLKPLDEKTVIESINKTKFVVTIEDNSLIGGLASSIKELIVNRIDNCIVQTYGYPDVYVKQGTNEEIEKEYGLDVQNISQNIINEIKQKLKIEE